MELMDADTTTLSFAQAADFYCWSSSLLTWRPFTEPELQPALPVFAVTYLCVHTVGLLRPAGQLMQVVLYLLRNNRSFLILACLPELCFCSAAHQNCVLDWSVTWKRLSRENNDAKTQACVCQLGLRLSAYQTRKHTLNVSW